jgi:hypothetical protein
MAAFSAGAAVGLLGGMIGLGVVSAAAADRPIRLCRPASSDCEQGDELGGGVDRATGAAGCRALHRLDGALAGRGQLLAGSLAGAWAGASLATRMATTLHKVLAGLLVLMAAALVWSHLDGTTHSFSLTGQLQAILGLAAGFAIGAVAAVMGVAGGELLIPTIVLLYGIDIKVAGSLLCPLRR